MIRGMVVVNKITGERKLFIDKEEETQYVHSLLSERGLELPFKLYPFEKMTDSEKINVLEFNYDRMKEFEDSISGTGRSYNNEIRLGFKTFEWVLNRLTE